MREIANAIPDVDMLLALAPEELAAKLLFLVRTRFRGTMFHPNSLYRELWETFGMHQVAYPHDRAEDVHLALVEAWSWLEAQGLVVPAADTNGQNGWRLLSRRARSMENEADFAYFRVARLLPRELLHPKIAAPVWLAFMRGDYDQAVMKAMKAVEVSVREASGLGNELVGVKLMRPAFLPENGPLTDTNAEGGERVGRMELFAGAIASYKNPQSHRDVNLDNPAEAIEIILLANHLLRIVDARLAAKTEGIA